RSESSWCDSKPFDAYRVTQRREVRSYNKVADGETCSTARVDRGDGSFKKEKRCTTKYKEVPVYAQKCYYTVNRWGYERDIQSRGGLNDTPVWPAVNIRAGNCLGCERESGRSEAFVLHLVEVKKADKKHNCSYDEAKWRSIPDKAIKKIKVRLLGGAKCDTLQ
ncbi:MAG TPA: zinc ribbon domain-containing protein, partial [Turneriella sp.]|nr:zinc ribbon domain-containing protein [Turneriella sp.]